MAAKDDLPLYCMFLGAGVSGCIADFVTFPLDTIKIRLQVQRENMDMSGPKLKGLLRSFITLTRTEGVKSFYNGLSVNLQRQMCFVSIRIGLYEKIRDSYIPLFDFKSRGGEVLAQISAGITTGGMAVLLAQPTDVAKIRLQSGVYKSTKLVYKNILKEEGLKGLWRGTSVNMIRNSIINVSEIVVYDLLKTAMLRNKIIEDSIGCHVAIGAISGLTSSIFASPADVVRTRYMNSPKGYYRNFIDCTIKMIQNERFMTFYEGFLPSFCRVVSWNIIMWVTFEEIKKLLLKIKHMSKR